MIKCETIDQFRLCKWILTYFDEDTIDIVLVSKNQIHIFACDGYIDASIDIEHSISYECHLYFDDILKAEGFSSC